MTREIKFRGKRIDNGEWVYGSYFKINYHDSVDYIERDVIILENGHEFDIDIETLGQFTGLHDKNGKEIYEGDIIEREVSDRPYSSNKKYCMARYEVKWDEQNHQNNEHNNDILLKNPSAFNRNPGFYAKEIWNEKGYGCMDWSPFSSCEVIGNIYQNKNLLN